MSDKELFDTVLTNVIKIVALVMRLVAYIEAENQKEDLETMEKVIKIIGGIAGAL